MRRFLTLVCLLCLAIPAGISISGCTRNPGANYCNGLGYGMKITDVATITLQPETTGISLAFGQTRQANTPSAVTCKGTAASASSYTYGTTNNQLVDISPTGNICAGTWNRDSGGGIPDYTICSAPSPLPATGKLPYAVAYITASAQAVTSNPVEVFVHAPVTSVSLVTQPTSGTAQKCFSQGTQAVLDAQACYSEVLGGQPTNVLLCAPASVTTSSSPSLACPLPTINGQQLPLSSIPNCTTAVGTLSYSVGTSNIASITTNTNTNQVTITAEQPGTTSITASVSQSGSSAGYFSTCPPASISVTLANGSTSGTITQGVTQNLVTTIADTYGVPLTGISLTYQSTDPIDISASSSGAITTSFPGEASVYAICQPPGCNPSPINETGVYGTGLPISSNPVSITTPGTASDYAWFSAPGKSQYIVPVDLLTGTVGSTIRLPYVPTSMVMDQLGTNLYFGSTHELVTYSTSANSYTATTAVPGVVLAVSPNDLQLLINDQVRQLFYLYYTNGGSTSTFGGMGTVAAWTPDSQTLYIVDRAAENLKPENIAAGTTNHADTLYIYNANTGWTTYPLPCSVYNATTCPSPSTGAQSVAIPVPSVGAFISGTKTIAHTWCPSGIVGNYASMSFYPQGPAPDNTVATQTDILAATIDGKHILGASAAGSSIALSDIGVTIPALNCLPAISDPNYPLILGDTLSPLPLQTTLSQLTVGNAQNPVNAASIDQIVPAPTSSLAFITYTPPASGAATGVSLPYYLPGTGTVGYVPFKGSTASITAPLAGAFTPDDKLFFVSTAGDNMIHYISVPLVTSTPASADTQQISPNLPSCTPISAGGADLGCAYTGPNPGTAIVPATAIAVKPRSTT